MHSFLNQMLNFIEANMDNLFCLIKFYLDLGSRHREIVLSLSHIDGIMITLSTLRRHLRTLQLFRRKAHSDLLDVALFLQDQLDRYGMLHGYKIVHLKCIQAGHVVTQRYYQETAENFRSARSAAEVPESPPAAYVPESRPKLFVACRLV